MIHLGDPRIGIAGDESYAPFEPRVAFSYSSSSVIVEGALPPAAPSDTRFDALPFAAESPAPEAAPLESRLRSPENEIVPLSEYQWSGPGRHEPWRRVLDAVLSCALLVLFAPLLGLVAIFLRLQDGGPALVSDRRIGRFGREIELLRFRTRSRGNPQAASFGRLLRRSGIASLPRLLNVLRGDLSFVGPRPAMEADLPSYGLDVIYYLAGRPGLTGEWRVQSKLRANAVARQKREREYARTRTFDADLRFLLITLPSALIGKKAA